MCGIAGIFMREGAPDPTMLRRMVERLRHRGPDGEGLLLRPQAAFGHRRLALHGNERHGAQPMHCLESSWRMVANATFHDAAASSLKPGHGLTPEDLADCTALLDALKTEGPSGFFRPNGPMAAAALAPDEASLYLARDAVGEKPLFFADLGHAVVFASELRAITPALPAITWDREVVRYVLNTGFQPPEKTLIEGVFAVPPGQALEFQRGRSGHTVAATEPAPPQAPSSPADLECALGEAIARRRTSPHPAALLLSGGLDSAHIGQLALQREGPELPAYTLQFQQRAFDETQSARDTAQRLGLEHRIIQAPRDPTEALRALIEASGEPLADASWIALHTVARAAKQDGIRILLGGDGADELLLGYRRQRAARLSTLPHWLQKLAQTAAGLSGNPRLREGLQRIEEGPEAVWADLVGLAPKASRERLLRAPFQSLQQQLHFAPRGDRADRQAALWDETIYLPQDLCVKADRAAMANGIEIWAPFLDREVRRAAHGLPSAALASWWQGKKPLRRALRRVLPGHRTRERKRGFGVPLAQWLEDRAGYGGFVKELLRAEQTFLAPELHPEALEALCTEEGFASFRAPLVHALAVLCLSVQTLRSQ